MTVPIAMVTGIEIRTQSRTVRRMVKDRALGNEYALTARGWVEMRLIFET
jgi:hypothetical protein